MDHYSLLDHSAPSPEAAGKASKKRDRRPEIAGVSAAIAEENTRVGSSLPARFPGEDSGYSFAEMARADLDAALQLLADRAQYITGASGAAIALRRGEHNDMLCRARVGSNAPELGALLSMEYGLSGESVRSRQLLRCDDAERDPRVNRMLCRELGIASVLVMPISKEQQVLGVFELFAGKPNAFNDRDLSALTRLAEMVATAVKLSGASSEAIALAIPLGKAVSEPRLAAKELEIVVLPAELHESDRERPAIPAVQEIPPTKPETSESPKKALFWSAALQRQAGECEVQSGENSIVPPGLRNLRKCEACGFPVSQSRTLCVECEEKQWRGRAQPAIAKSANQARERAEVAGAQSTQSLVREAASQIPVVETQPPAVARLAMAAAASAAGNTVSPLQRVKPPSRQETVTPGLTPDSSLFLETRANEEIVMPTHPPAETPAAFLSSVVPEESWLTANKYILFALLVVALIIAAIAVWH